MLPTFKRNVSQNWFGAADRSAGSANDLALARSSAGSTMQSLASLQHLDVNTNTTTTVGSFMSLDPDYNSAQLFSGSADRGK
jgi:hypothetical protein